MSNPLRYDSLLVRHLATELHERLAGRAAAGLYFDTEHRMLRLDLDTATLVWELHPTRGRVALVERPPAGAGAPSGDGVLADDGKATTVAAPRNALRGAGLPGEVRLPRRAQVGAVAAPADERVITIRLRGSGAAQGRARRLVVELITNHWNALAIDGTDRILAVMATRSAAGRALRPGATYEAPPPTARTGADEPIDLELWRELLAGLPPEERRRTLVSRVAYTSPQNAGALLGPAARTTDAAELDAAHERYRDAVTAPSSPRVLLVDPPQAYPVPLPDLPDLAVPSLLDAIERAGGGEPAPAVAPAVPPALLNRLDHRMRQLGKRADRLREELEGARPGAAALRRRADLLLSHVHLVRKGMREVELPDFEGGTATVELDPALEPAENAQRLYDAARKRERAADRLPRMLASARAEGERLASLRSRAESGAANAEEIEAAVGHARAQRPGSPPPMLPYRRYRTSGGREVRVGRGSRHNDELTFGHSSPEDIWLHAREAAGAHVILRWTDKDANPPARELLEAAVLAALHSRSRTAGTVAVDWTRRKHVRKPRKAPPGLVTPGRVSTLFVEPDPALEKRLRSDDPGV